MGHIRNKAEELKGAAKEKLGEATDNESLQADGTRQKHQAKAKQVVEDIKDTD